MIKKIIYTIITSLCLISCHNNHIFPELIENNTNGELDIQTKSSLYQIDSFDINNYPYTMEEDSLFLETILGKIRSIVDRHEYYVVNEEFIYLKEELIERPIGNSSRLYGTLLKDSCQYIYLSLHNGTDNNNVSYDNDLIIFKEAVAEWNNLGNCNIFFALSDDENYMGNPREWFEVNVYIDDAVEVNSNQIHYFAEDGMNYLWGGTQSDMPFLNIWFNVSNDTYNEFDDETKKYSMMHALGHLVRLKDTELADDWISGTYSGVSSIMNSYSYLSNNNDFWRGFSIYDRLDLESIYPLIINSIDLTVVSNVTSNNIHEYTFIPRYDAVKPVSGYRYEYVIETETDNDSYESSVVNDTLKVNFYYSEIVTITLNLILNDVIQYSCTKDFYIEGEHFNLPDKDDVKVGQEFTIEWCCGANEAVTFSAVENIFDHNDQNIKITQQDKGKATILLKDYGSFSLVMEKVDSDNRITAMRVFYIDRLYRPEMYITDYYGTDEVFDFRQDAFEVGRLFPDNFNDIVFTGTNQAYTFTIADGGPLQGRFYALQYEKFYRDAFLPPARVDRGSVVIVYNCRERKLSKGQSGIITVPQGRNGYISVPEPGWLTYKGYYALVIPEDKVYLR